MSPTSCVAFAEMFQRGENPDMYFATTFPMCEGVMIPGIVRDTWRIAASALLSLLLCGGCATDKAVMLQANQFDSNLKPAEVRNAEVDVYFQQIGARVLAAAKESDAAHFGPKTHYQGGSDQWMFNPQNIQFHLVNSQTLNAFTTGGDHVYVYNALFQQCKDEDELAAVMAHEFGHIYSKHVQKGMNRQMALMIGVGAAGAAGYAAGGSQNGAQYAQAGGSFAQMVGQFANMGFTRGDEAQADEMGFHFYWLAGWDPRDFGAFFQHMIDRGLDTPSALTSDHPTLKSRVQIANERVAQLEKNGTIDKYRQPNIATQAAFNRYKQLAVQSAQGIPNDQQVLQAKQLLQALPRSCWVPYEPKDQTEAREALLEKAKQQEAAQSPQK